jgi:hypothetical protein
MESDRTLVFLQLAGFSQLPFSESALKAFLFLVPAELATLSQLLNNSILVLQILVSLRFIEDQDLRSFWTIPDIWETSLGAPKSDPKANSTVKIVVKQKQQLMTSLTKASFFKNNDVLYKLIIFQKMHDVI